MRFEAFGILKSHGNDAGFGQTADPFGCGIPTRVGDDSAWGLGED